MKELFLNDITPIIGLKPIKKKIKIKRVTRSIRDLDSSTLVFHLNRLEDLDSSHVKQLKDCFIVTDQPFLCEEAIPHILSVPDVLQAYQKFMRYYRRLFKIPVVAITGTCGKTTTKEMIRQVLSKKGKVASTFESRNALRFTHDYLLGIDEQTHYGVFETAITEPGHIIYNCQFFQPNIGVITNIGIDHLNECKTIDHYLKTKGELLAGLHYKGTLIINYDDPQLKRLDYSAFQGTIKTFGLNEQADYSASEIEQHGTVLTFMFHHLKDHHFVKLPLIGHHNVYNACAALAVLDTLNIPLPFAIQILEAFKPVKAHLQFYKGKNDNLIIDDTFSSNPTSVKAALDALDSLHFTKIILLGNIAYLGKFEAEQADEIGKMCAQHAIDYLITIDSFSHQIGKAAIRYGMNPERVFFVLHEQDILDTLSSLLKPKTLTLFKISMFDKTLNKLMKAFIE